MKTKNYLISLFLISFFFLSCNKEIVEIKQGEDQLRVSDEIITFNGNETKDFSFSTYLSLMGDYKIASYPQWVTLSQKEGTVGNYPVRITITSDFSGEKPGLYEGNLVIQTFLGNKTILLKGIAGEYVSYRNLPKNIDVPANKKTSSIRLLNDGNVAIRYTVSSSNNLVSITKTSGNIEISKEESINLTINRETLETGVYESKLYFNINDKLDTVLVKIENIIEKKTILKAEIVDAEFSKSNNKLVYVSSNPMSLFVYNTNDKSTKETPLAYMPTCVSISPDGKFAAVGYDARVSLVDLTSNTLVSTVDVPCSAYDITLTNNKWAYVVPNTDQWVSIQCVNLSTGLVSQHTGGSVREKSAINLQPQKNYFYYLDYDLEKMSIKDGTAKYLYDSPYHGDYPMGYNFWFSEDGNRIFTAGTTVVKCSELQSQDMSYNGKINLQKEEGYDNMQIQWLTHSASKENLYMVCRYGYYHENKYVPYIYVHNANNLLFKKKFELEKYLVGDNDDTGTSYQANPHWVFSNAAGSDVYVITKANGSGLLHEWALQEFKID